MALQNIVMLAMHAPCNNILTNSDTNIGFLGKQNKKKSETRHQNKENT